MLQNVLGTKRKSAVGSWTLNNVYYFRQYQFKATEYSTIEKHTTRQNTSIFRHVSIFKIDTEKHKDPVSSVGNSACVEEDSLRRSWRCCNPVSSISSNICIQYTGGVHWSNCSSHSPFLMLALFLFLYQIPPSSVHLYSMCAMCSAQCNNHSRGLEKEGERQWEGGKKAATNQEQAPVLHFKGLTLRATSFSTHH